MPNQNLQYNKTIVRTSPYKSECKNAIEIIIEACHDKTDKSSEDSDKLGHLMVSKKNPLFV